jgi:hypothetical protein
MAFSARFREIHSVGLASLPERGPVVLVGWETAPLYWRRLPRRIDLALTLFSREQQGQRQVKGRWHLPGALALPTPRVEGEAGLAVRLHRHLESGHCLFLRVRDGASAQWLAERLLASESTHAHRMGIVLLIMSCRASAPLALRRDLWCRLKRSSGWDKLVDRYREDAAGSVLALSHSLMEALGTLPADVGGDEILMDRLARLETLELDDELDPDPTVVDRLRQRLKQLQLKSGDDPARLRELRDATHTLWHLVQKLNIRDRSFYIHSDLRGLRRRTGWRLVSSALLAVPGLWGIANHYVIYKFPEWLDFWRGRVPSKCPRPNLTRLLLFLPVYWAQYALVDRLAGRTWAALYLLTLPLCGYAGLLLVENRTMIWDNVCLLKLLRRDHAVKRELLDRRWELLERLGEPRRQPPSGSLDDRPTSLL